MRSLNIDTAIRFTQKTLESILVSNPVSKSNTTLGSVLLLNKVLAQETEGFAMPPDRTSEALPCLSLHVLVPDAGMTERSLQTWVGCQVFEEAPKSELPLEAKTLALLVPQGMSWQCCYRTLLQVSNEDKVKMRRVRPPKYESRAKHIV